MTYLKAYLKMKTERCFSDGIVCIWVGICTSLHVAYVHFWNVPNTNVFFPQTSKIKQSKSYLMFFKRYWNVLEMCVSVMWVVYITGNVLACYLRIWFECVLKLLLLVKSCLAHMRSQLQSQYLLLIFWYLLWWSLAYEYFIH